MASTSAHHVADKTSTAWPNCALGPRCQPTRPPSPRASSLRHFAGISTVIYRATLEVQPCRHITTFSPLRTGQASEDTAHMENSGQAPCPARQTLTGREQPPCRPGEEENQGGFRPARYHRPNLRPWHRPNPPPPRTPDLLLPRGRLWPVLRVNWVQQQRKPQRPRYRATISPRTEHGSRRNISTYISHPDSQIEPQSGLREEPVRWATSSPRQVRLLIAYQRREARRTMHQTFRALPPGLPPWRSRLNPLVRTRVLRTSL